MASLRRSAPPLSSILLALLVTGCPALVSDPFQLGPPDDDGSGGTTGGSASGGSATGGARVGGSGPLGSGGTGAVLRGGTGGGPIGTGGTGADSGGAAGATVSPPLGGQAGSAPDPLLIDDLEDGDNFILVRAGRQGDWYGVNDESAGGNQDWGVDSAESYAGTTSMHSQAWGYTNWGAGIGLNLNNPGTGKGTYDASAYAGISFWLRVGAYSSRTITIYVPDRWTDPEGGACVGDYCYDHFQTTITAANGWVEYRVPFSMMRQEGFGTPRFALDTSALYGVEFRTGANQNHDFWVDDISFYE